MSGGTRLQERHLRLMDAALALRRAGEHGEALKILTKLREEIPDYAPLYLLLGLTYQDLGNPAEAESHLRRSLELEPDYPDAIQALGLFLTRQGQWAEAAVWLRRHLEKNPKDPITLQAIGTTLLWLGREEEAVQTLQKAWLETTAEEPGVQYGRLLIRLNRQEEAESVLRQVAERLPSARTLTEWATALTLMGRYTEAARALEKAAELNPEFDRAWRGLAYCYNRMGMPDRALEASEKSLALNPRHYRNWQAKADVLLNLEKFEDALEAANEGIRLISPEDEEARPVLRELLAQKIEALAGLGRLDEAVGVCEQASRDFPTDSWFLGTAVSLLLILHRPEEALNFLERVRQAGTPEEILPPLYYQVLHALGRPDEAWLAVEPALRLEPAHRPRRLHILASLGVELYTFGYIAASRAVFEQLHGVTSEEPRFACNLGFVLVGENELERAELLFQKALEASDEDMRTLVHANLGYLYLITGRYDEARSSLNVAEQGKGEAILRIAYWRNNAIVPDYLAHPRRFLPIPLAARANRVALLLALSDVQAAESLAQEIASEQPDSFLSHLILGTVAAAKGNPEEAQQLWEKALRLTPDPAERESLRKWLGI